MDDGEQAVMCVLMLRGAQTPGELKQRSERMHPFGELSAVHATLEGLIDRGLVARLDRRPGHKEERYVQLLQDGDENLPAAVPQPGMAAPPATATPAEPTPAGDSSELEMLRERVERLEHEVAELRAAMRNPVYEHQS